MAMVIRTSAFVESRYERIGNSFIADPQEGFGVLKRSNSFSHFTEPTLQSLYELENIKVEATIEAMRNVKVKKAKTLPSKVLIQVNEMLDNDSYPTLLGKTDIIKSEFVKTENVSLTSEIMSKSSLVKKEIMKSVQTGRSAMARAAELAKLAREGGSDGQKKQPKKQAN